MSGYSLERSDRDGIRLLPFERDLFDTPPSPPDVPAHPVVPLESFHLETIGQTSVEQVALASFYLGARSPSEERRQHIWRYRPEWTYFDRVTALQQMEAEYRQGYLVRCFQLPALALYTAGLVLLVAQLDTDRPFYRASMRTVGPEGVAFAPHTLSEACNFVRAGQAPAHADGWFFALVSRADFPPGWWLPGPAPSYTVSTRRYQRRQTKGKGPAKADFGWWQRSLGVTDEFLRKLALATIQR